MLALEESCPFWMDKGFTLEQGRPLNARLNIFNDTHLLRLGGDPQDAGDEKVGRTTAQAPATEGALALH